MDDRRSLGVDDIRRIARDALLQHSSAWEIVGVSIEAQGLRARIRLRDRTREVALAVPVGSAIALRSAIAQWLDDVDE